jgi:hypothetical protein
VPELPQTYAPQHPAAVWTSFDRYARYGAIVGALRATLGKGHLRVLDVGDPSGYLTVFDDDLSVVCADLSIVDAPLPGAARLAGDGTALPFADRSFDAVVSSDALEHVPDDVREPFLVELARVAARAVVVAAPFATEGVAGAEALARRYVLLVTGEEQDQLEEHAQRGLPHLDRAVGVLRACGLDVAVEGNGNLDDWLHLMMLKHQLMARPALSPLDPAYDIAYNEMLVARNHVPPFYRHVICACRDGAPAFAPAPGATADAPASPVATWLTAAVAELARQDTATQVASVHQRLEVTEQRLSHSEAALQEIMRSLGDLRGVVDSTHGLIRHPVKSVVSKVQRRSE